MKKDEKQKPRKRSNPSKKADEPFEINIQLKVIAKPTEGVLDIREFSIEPEDRMTISDIGNLLGNNVVNFLILNTKPSPKIKV